MNIITQPSLVGSLLFTVLISGCAGEVDENRSASSTGTPCTDDWYQSIEEQVGTGDGQGHGPDIGSEEWKSVIEFRLGIRGQSDVPKRDIEAWCQHIDRLVSGEAQ